MTGLAVSTGFATGASIEYVGGQLALAASVAVSLFLLSERPLLNPVQAGVIGFYWWFGVGPTVTATHAYLAGQPSGALAVEAYGQESLWLVAAGLPLYSAAGRHALRFLAKYRLHAHFLMPAGSVYRPLTLALYWGVGLACLAGPPMFSLLGLGSVTTANYLGGTRTDFWLAGVLLAASQLAGVATAGALFHLAARGWRSPLWLKIVTGSAVIFGLNAAITGGWKGAFLGSFAIFVSAYVSVRQRPPWIVLVVLALMYLAVVEPFVASGRWLAQTAGATTDAEREAIFRQHLRQDELVVPDWRAWNVASPFRGIYPLAGEVTRSSSWLDGPWHGETILWGFSAIVPRALYPQKPDMAIGNFFARTVGVSAGVSRADDFAHNVSLSIPFEVAGNFGWLAAILSFGLLGGFWALWCGWLLSSSRISTHPLSGLLVVSAMMFEQSIGSFLARQRDFVFVLFAAFLVWVVRRRL